MEALVGRRVVLGVSGGIAAYKAVEICRRLVDAGAHVMPVLTAGATRFVGPLTFSALASEPARTSRVLLVIKMRRLIVVCHGCPGSKIPSDEKPK